MQAEVKEEPKDVNSDQSEDLEDWLDTVIQLHTVTLLPAQKNSCYLFPITVRLVQRLPNHHWRHGVVLENAKCQKSFSNIKKREKMIVLIKSLANDYVVYLLFTLVLRFEGKQGFITTVDIVG